MTGERPYGQDDASYQAAGGESGIRQLVDNFFGRMGRDPRFRTIWDMHPDDKDVSRDKLARFLCGWLGGPKLFSEKYGSISIPRDHQHLPIGHAEKTQWLTCMQESIDEQPFRADFKHYLLDALHVPAEGVRKRRQRIINEQFADELQVGERQVLEMVRHVHYLVRPADPANVREFARRQQMLTSATVQLKHRLGALDERARVLEREDAAQISEYRDKLNVALRDLAVAIDEFRDVTFSRINHPQKVAEEELEKLLDNNPGVLKSLDDMLEYFRLMSVYRQCAVAQP